MIADGHVFMDSAKEVDSRIDRCNQEDCREMNKTEPHVHRAAAVARCCVHGVTKALILTYCNILIAIISCTVM